MQIHAVSNCDTLGRDYERVYASTQIIPYRLPHESHAIFQDQLVFAVSIHNLYSYRSTSLSTCACLARIQEFRVNDILADSILGHVGNELFEYTTIQAVLAIRLVWLG